MRKEKEKEKKLVSGRQKRIRCKVCMKMKRLEEVISHDFGHACIDCESTALNEYYRLPGFFDNHNSLISSKKTQTWKSAIKWCLG